MPNLTVFQATMLAERAYGKSGIDPDKIDTDLMQQLLTGKRRVTV